VQQLGQVGAEGGRAAGFQDDDRRRVLGGQFGQQKRIRQVERAPQHRAGAVQLARSRQ
jgi:hypothetical protein